MKTLIALPLALGIALTSSVAALAANGGYEQLHSHRAIHHRIVAAPRAEALVPVTILPARSPWSSPFSYHETDGLSRDPGDCLKYGCIDNGGGG
jgi:hypothetical protein